MTQRASTLVTGVAGFIGSFVAQRLLERGTRVVGLDDLNDYYDPELKRARLARLERFRADSQFAFELTNIVDAAAVERVFTQNAIESVVHLAAQAGVRHSITHPQDYIDSNLTGFLNMLQAVRARPVRHFVYASSSSVYGGNTKLPFSESDRVDRPVSLYAATKRANEQMAYVYSWQFGVPATGLRFFTVYGPWGRPDMATFRFTKAIIAGEPIIGIRAAVLIRPGHDRNAVAASIKEKLERRVNTLGLGNAVLYSEVMRDCMEVAGVMDVQQLHLRRCPPLLATITFGKSERFQNQVIEAAVGENIPLVARRDRGFSYRFTVD